MLERMRLCRFCKREMDATLSAYEQNPFCNVCYQDRLATVPARKVTLVHEGDRVRFVYEAEND